MKNKLKTFLSFAIAGTMLFTLTGCGEKEEEKDTNKAGENNDFITNQVQTSTDNNSKIDLGKWENNIYSNGFLDLKINLPEGWKIATDEELAKMMNIGSEIVANENEYLAEVAKLTGVYYASANNPSTGDNLLVFSEKPLRDASIDEYIEATKTNLQAMSSMKYTIKGTDTETIGNRTYNTLTVEVKDAGITQRYYLYKQGQYFIGIIVTSVSGESTIDEIAKNIK